MTDRELLELAAKAAGIELHCEYEEFKDQDPYAATRRAIVRTAAKIGKEMK